MAKGKCINIDKPCELALSEEIQEADSANFVCRSCGKPLVEVSDSKDKGSKSDVTTTPPKGKGLLIGLCIVGVAALGGGGYLLFGGNHDKETIEQTDPQPGHEPGGGTENDGQDTENGAQDTEDGAQDTEDGAQDTEDGQKVTVKEVNPSNYLTGYSLGYGLYTGPAEGGVPDGPGGTIDVKKAYTLDLKNGGETLDFAPGDKVVNCKFRNGKLVQGFLKRKHGEGKNFNIGI